MSDQDLANNIHDAVDGLNRVLRLAESAGLRVEIDVLDVTEFGDRAPVTASPRRPNGSRPLNPSERMSGDVS